MGEWGSHNSSQITLSMSGLSSQEASKVPGGLSHTWPCCSDFLLVIMEEMLLPKTNLNPCALDPIPSDLALQHQRIFLPDWFIPISIITNCNFPHLNEWMNNQSINQLSLLPLPPLPCTAYFVWSFTDWELWCVYPHCPLPLSHFCRHYCMASLTLGVGRLSSITPNVFNVLSLLLCAQCTVLCHLYSHDALPLLRLTLGPQALG